MLRCKKLTYFLLSYYKKFKIFKFNNIKKKINNFNHNFFSRYNCDFDFDFKILFKMWKNWVFIKRLKLINYTIILKKSSSLINSNNDLDMKLFEIIILLNK